MQIIIGLLQFELIRLIEPDWVDLFVAGVNTSR